MRPSFLDDVSAAQARRRTRTARSRGRASGARARDGAGAVGHEMSRHYVLEYPVDDPDESWRPVVERMSELADAIVSTFEWHRR